MDRHHQSATAGAGAHTRPDPPDPVVHNGTVELVFNIVWLITALTLLSIAIGAVHNGQTRLPMASTMLATVMLCFILLPISSISDDLVEARQTALPLSGQSWRMASEGLTAGLDRLAAVAFCFLLIVYAVLDGRWPRCEQSDTRNFAEWLTRSQRLRPPPFAI